MEHTEHSPQVEELIKNTVMDTADALQIVYDLATRHMAHPGDDPITYAKQTVALRIFHDISVNDYGDD